MNDRLVAAAIILAQILSRAPTENAPAKAAALLKQLEAAIYKGQGPWSGP